MADSLSKEQRSHNMAKIKGRDTSPELAVRRTAHRLGLRYRLHCRDLPGTPDLVFAKHQLVIFVHGCFWHRHAGCRFAYTPKSRVKFWTEKFKQNVTRDLRNENTLISLGWRVDVIWECETHNGSTLESRLRECITKS
ncbi:MAG: DNA mismatch endonuclease Vsr [Gemmatimonadetes bacterium]|nr:DNA mismatch endonuclease Vsr [Gemmatimonadota bacterium]